MILSLSIKNFLLIESIFIDLSEGLTVLTGETGSGKSILLEAINVCLGGRLVEDLPNNTSATEIALDFEYCPFFKGFWEAQGWETPTSPQKVCLRRVISHSTPKKNRFFLNDHAVNRSHALKIKEHFFDIHAQFDHLLIQDTLSKNIDNCIDKAFLGKVAHAFYQHKKDTVHYEELLALQKESLSGNALWDEILTDLDGIYENEEEELLALKQQLGQDVHTLQKLSRVLDENSVLPPLYQFEKEIVRTGQDVSRLSSIILDIESLVQEWQSAIHEQEERRTQLESIDERLYLLQKLKKRYNTNDLYRLFCDTKEKMGLCQTIDSDIVNAKNIMNNSYEIYMGFCKSLSAKRRAILDELSEHIKTSLTDLKLDHARIDFVLKEKIPDAGGNERIVIMATFNASQPLAPLDQCASGGELSRLLLILKMFKTHPDTCFIFDEIDTGTSGDVARRIGQKIKELSRRHKVLCITHSPHIAAFADQHIQIHKEHSKTYITLLSLDERIDELSQLLGAGEKDFSKKLATELLKSC